MQSQLTLLRVPFEYYSHFIRCEVFLLWDNLATAHFLLTRRHYIVWRIKFIDSFREKYLKQIKYDYAVHEQDCCIFLANPNNNLACKMY